MALRSCQSSDVPDAVASNAALQQAGLKSTRQGKPLQRGSWQYACLQGLQLPTSAARPRIPRRQPSGLAAALLPPTDIQSPNQ